MLEIPKNVFKKTLHNPNSRAASNYSVVEDLSQAPCAMSALEVLQSCPAQRDALLAALGSMDLSSLTVKFHLSDVKIHLPYHVALSIDVIHCGKTIGRVVVDEGASTCVMSLTCWKALRSLELVPSNTLVTAFDGRSFHPHGILSAFEIKLAVKAVYVEVEVIDAPLDYNLLLGRN